jgi:sugar phosphate isomerase/epimerase
MALRGMQIAEMKNLIATFRREASNIRASLADVNAAVSLTWWKGNDAEKFRREWADDHRRRILEVATELDALAINLDRALTSQVKTSQ